MAAGVAGRQCRRRCRPAGGVWSWWGCESGSRRRRWTAGRACDVVVGGDAAARRRTLARPARRSTAPRPLSRSTRRHELTRDLTPAHTRPLTYSTMLHCTALQKITSVLRKINKKTAATKAALFLSNRGLCTESFVGRGFDPPHWGSLQRSPDPLAAFRGLLLKGGDEGRGREFVLCPKKKSRRLCTLR